MNQAEALKTKSDIHLTRKIWHTLGVLLLFFVLTYYDHITSIQIFLIFAVTSITVDVVRKFNPRMNTIMTKFFKPVMRKSEQNNWAGTTYLSLGVLVSTVLFPYQIVGLSLLFLAFADPIASYAGVKWGKDKLIGHKSLQGSIAAFFMCTILSAFYFHHHNIMVNRLVIVSLLSGFFGSIAELIPIGKIDDNFSLPLLSCLFLYILFYLFSGF